MGAERERELTDLGFRFREVKSGVPRVFRVHFLLANLKPEQEGKAGSLEWSVVFALRSFCKGDLRGWGGLSARGTSVAGVSWPCVEVCRGPCVY